MIKGQRTIATLLAIIAVLLGLNLLKPDREVIAGMQASEFLQARRIMIANDDGEPRVSMGMDLIGNGFIVVNDHEGNEVFSVRGNKVTMPRSSHSPTPRSKPSQQQPLPAAGAAIPGDVTYTIFDQQIVPRIKRQLAIRLNQKVSTDVLRSIALELKRRDPNPYERTLITYYLPGMELGGGAAWATTHFDPKLAVRLLGLTEEEERDVIEKSLSSHRGKVLGRWLDDRSHLGYVIIIYREGGKWYIESGITTKHEIVEVPTAKGMGRKFSDPREGNDFGEYYVIDAQGNFQYWDADGHIYTCRPVRK